MGGDSGDVFGFVVWGAGLKVDWARRWSFSYRCWGGFKFFFKY